MPPWAIPPRLRLSLADVLGPRVPARDNPDAEPGPQATKATAAVREARAKRAERQSAFRIGDWVLDDALSAK
eukprot:13508793-Alexandrium_andersonii.AAC.1